MARSALRLADIDAFYGDSHVLHGISFELGEGRLLGLLGRNGAGKSTCMHVTMGLLPPRFGAIELFGEPITRRAPEVVAARGVSLVPQGRRIFRSLTVRENLAVAGRKSHREASVLGPSSACSTPFRASASGNISSQACCPEASSRCWRLAGH